MVQFIIVLSLTVAPAGFKLSCNSFQVTALFSPTFIFISLRACCEILGGAPVQE